MGIFLITVAGLGNSLPYLLTGFILTYIGMTLVLFKFLVEFTYLGTSDTPLWQKALITGVGGLGLTLLTLRYVF